MSVYGSSLQGILVVLLTVGCGPGKQAGAEQGEGVDGSDDAESTSTSTDTSTVGATDDPASTDSDTSTSSTDSESDGFVFIIEPDMSFPCSFLSQCDTFAQDCPEGERCTPIFSDLCGYGTVACTPILGDKQPGEPCTMMENNADDCGADSFCYPAQLGVDQPSICVALCTGSFDDALCPPGLTCGFDSLMIQDQIGCHPPCDPLAPDCEPGEVCTLANLEQADFACLPAADPLAAVGEGCMLNQECSSGSCMDAALLPECAGTRCCAALCDLQNPDCAAPLTCLPVQDELPDSPVGVCVGG